MIEFNIPPYVGTELSFIEDVLIRKKICGDGHYTKLCSKFFEEKVNCKKVLLTTSCTHALEMAAELCDINEGDEVIMPSFTFVSTADAFVAKGAKIVFVDINPKTMNIDHNLIETAITEKTKAIVPVHYAGMCCDMDAIMKIAERHGLYVVEDAAQAVNSFYKGKALGSIGDFGCFSFHETKNYSMGEGGALLIKDEKYIEHAEIIREKGTNRSKFFRGLVDKYSWVDWGSSYLPSDLNAAHLWAQLNSFEEINQDRLNSWKKYYQELQSLESAKFIELPYVPQECQHNAHMFYIKTKDLLERTELMKFLKNNGIATAFHYVPLHSSLAGKKFGRFNGKDEYTTKESERLLRLPLYFGITQNEISYICEKIKCFYIEK